MKDSRSLRLRYACAALPLIACVAGCASEPTGKAQTGASTTSGASACENDPSSLYNPCFVPGSILAARKQVFSFRVKFERAADKKLTEQTIFDSGLIAIAIAGVLESFLRASPDAIGATAIGAGGLGAYRSYYDPSGERRVYLQAKTALNCILDQSQVLLYANAGAVSEAMKGRAAITTSSEAEAATQEIEVQSTEMLRQQSSDLSHDIKLAAASTTKANTAAQTGATDAAVDAARSAQQALNNEVAAYIQAPTAIWSALNKVIHFVDVGTLRTAPDVGTVQNGLNNAINQQAQSTANTLASRTQLINAIRQQGNASAQAGQTAAATATDALNKTTQTALASLPNPLYSTVVTNIQACAAGM